MENSKCCTKCRQLKPLSAFSLRMAQCDPCRKKSLRENYLKNHEQNKIKRREYNQTHPEYTEWRKEYRVKQKIEMLSRYGPKGEPACCCCGEKELSFLTIDHINGGGNQHRTSGVGAHNIGQWLRNNSWPEGFQTLCMNCNLSRRVNGGTCAHKIRSMEKKA